MATALIEPPAGWSGRQVLATRLRALGYRVDVWGAGDDWVLLIGVDGAGLGSPVGRYRNDADDATEVVVRPVIFCKGHGLCMIKTPERAA